MSGRNEAAFHAVAPASTGAGLWFNLPGVKPLSELGLKDFIVPGWNGLMAPKGTPRAIVNKLSAMLSQALKSAAARKGLNAIVLNPGTGTPQRLVELIENDTRRFTTVIRERSLKFEP